METFEPICRGIAAKLVRDLSARGEVDDRRVVGGGGGMAAWSRRTALPDSLGRRAAPRRVRDYAGDHLSPAVFLSTAIPERLRLATQINLGGRVWSVDQRPQRDGC